MSKKKKQTSFEQYIETLNEEQRREIENLFSDLEQSCCHLPKKDRLLLRRDFENVLLWYRDNNLSLDQAIHYVSANNLGGFFARPSLLWFPLDDAAKIYPIALKSSFMATFRLSAYLKDSVEPGLLQLALNFTVKRFPHFATTLKKGFFWHYLNARKRHYSVSKEDRIPCTPIRIASSGAPAFRVVYFNNRISVEFFHVLCDGYGGMQFLKSLVVNYLRLRYQLADDEAWDYTLQTPVAGESENAFEKYRKRVSAAGFMDKLAVQMNGKPVNHPYRLIHFKMNTNSLKEAAHRHNATVTAYLLALMFIAQKGATDVQSGEMAIQVPLNMRKFYPSPTLNNFSMYMIIRENIDNIGDISDLIENITSQMKEKGTEKNMDRMVASASRFVHMLRYIPLSMKTAVARQVYGFLGDKVFSNTLSNLGPVNLPDQYAKYIESMDFVLGTGITNRACCSLVSFGNSSTFSITQYTTDPSFATAMESLLSKENVEFVKEGSPLWK
jgi:NRPS condensation-like uncharacterized protein